MKIRILIADSDIDYLEHLSQALTESYAETFEVTTISAIAKVDIFDQRSFEVALLAPEFFAIVQSDFCRLQLLLWDCKTYLQPEWADAVKIQKYQRISSMAGEILRFYATVSDRSDVSDGGHAKITVVWSPVGGCGKTTEALAYASQRVSEGEKVLYLNLESFCSTPAFFSQSGKSISAIFEELDGNVELFMQSIRLQDRGSGIYYFCAPQNYADIHVLSEEDVIALVEVCSNGVDELVIDLSNVYDERTRRLLERADTVFLVLSGSEVGMHKWEQFQKQNDLYERLRHKLRLVANRGARIGGASAEGVINLPLVQVSDPIAVYKTLSVGYFS